MRAPFLNLTEIEILRAKNFHNYFLQQPQDQPGITPGLPQETLWITSPRRCRKISTMNNQQSLDQTKTALRQLHSRPPSDNTGNILEPPWNNTETTLEPTWNQLGNTSEPPWNSSLATLKSPDKPLQTSNIPVTILNNPRNHSLPSRSYHQFKENNSIFIYLTILKIDSI